MNNITTQKIFREITQLKSIVSNLKSASEGINRALKEDSRGEPRKFLKSEEFDGLYSSMKNIDTIIQELDHYYGKN